MSPKKKIIYDLWSNNGDDIPYYLKRADLVIAVEANPALCDQIKAKFGSQISFGKLKVENIVLTDADDGANVPFYLSKLHHVHGQFPRPDDSTINQYDRVLLPSKSICSLLREHGDPYYIKIDLEHYDEIILKSLFEHNIRPPYISAESHSVAIFCLLVALGGYNAFKLVDGRSVSTEYSNCQISGLDGLESYSFPMHSAGPFGDDIDGNWFTAGNFFRLLAAEGLGWKDIHATNTVIANPDLRPKVRFGKALGTFARYVMRPRIPNSVWHVCSRIYQSL